MEIFALFANEIFFNGKNDIFANESTPFVLDSTIFFYFLQETIIRAHLRLYLWNPP